MTRENEGTMSHQRMRMKHAKYFLESFQVRIQVPFLLCLFVLLGSELVAQKKVAITLDDLPNATIFETHRFEPVLLNKIDSLDIPVAVFINEGQLIKTSAHSENIELLRAWCAHPNVTLGNHTRDHVRYSEVGFEKFCKNIESGEVTTKSFTKRFNKPLTYFRFPYNDLGSDEAQRVQIEKYLDKRDYVVTPFTIESSDWMFNAVYLHYLKNGKLQEADSIGKAYVRATLELFDFYEGLSADIYKRQVKQIYLCHDNALNADYLDVLVAALQEREYAIVSLDEAMEDEIYQQTNVYNQKWGISWFYRWMEDAQERLKIMRSEPGLESIENEYNRLFAPEK